MRIRNKIIFIISIIVMILGLNVYFGQAVSAITSEQTLLKKSLVIMMRQCYTAEYMHNEVTASSSLKLKDEGSSNSANSIFTNKDKETSFIIPTFINNTIKDGNISCGQAIKGYGSGSSNSIRGLLSLYSKPTFNAVSNGTNLVSLGYERQDSATQNSVGYYTYDISYLYKTTSGNVTDGATRGVLSVVIDTNGNVVTNEKNCYGTPSEADFCVEVDTQAWGADMLYFHLKPSIDDYGYASMSEVSIFCTKTYCEAPMYGGTTDSRGYYIDVDYMNAFYGSTKKEFSDFNVTVSFEEDNTQTVNKDDYEIKNFGQARAHFLDYLGASGDDSWTNEDSAALYYYYVQGVFDSNNNSDFSIASDDCKTVLDGSESDYYVPYDSKWCKIIGIDNVKVEKNGPANKDKKFALVGNGGTFTLTSGSGVSAFKEVVRELMKYAPYLNLEEAGTVISPTVDPNNPDDSDDSDPVKPTCANSGAAGSLGWIVCPILTLLSNTAGEVYTKYVEPALQVKPTLFSGQGDSYGTGFAWGIFQGIANTIFIILLLFVIFSQLTGIGIDNYGIKKILPKLIIAAILINLSYIICVVLVDLSNILGNGLQEMFSNLPIQGGYNNNYDIIIDSKPIDVDVGSQVGSTALTGVIILVALVGGIWSAVADAGVLGGIILPLLLAALSIVIAVLFLFLLLAMRQAAIVVLTVISPLAFACYMLPNTKKLFDKWVKVGQGLLLVYPIVGLMVGGGDYISRLLLSTAGNEGFAMAFMAMIVGVVPIFFIPTILKGSFAAMGNIGAKLSGIGDRVRSGAKRGVQNNKLYKDAQERSKENAALRFAGVKRNKDGTYSNKELSGFGKFIRGGRRNVAASRAQFLANQEKRNKEDSYMGVGFDAASIAQQKRAEGNEVSDWEVLIKSKTRDGADTEAFNKLVEGYMDAKTGNDKAARAAARIAGRRKDTADAFINNFTKMPLADKNRKAVAAVAKEIAEGETSRNYIAAAPIKFDFASQINKDPENANLNYSGEEGWRSSQTVGQALDNYVTNSNELVGVKGSSLREIYDLMQTPGAMSPEAVSRLQTLATDTIANRDKGPWDSTKAEVLCKMSGEAFSFDSSTGKITDNRPSVAPSNNAERGGNAAVNFSDDGAAREGETFSARSSGEQRNGGEGDGGGRIQIATDGDLNEFLRNRGNQRQ